MGTLALPSSSSLSPSFLLGPNGLTLSLGAWLKWDSAVRIVVELSLLKNNYC